MKSRAWSGIVALFGVLALLLFALSILGAVPIRGTVIRRGPLYSSIILPGCLLVCCIAEFIRSQQSSRPLWLRVTSVAMIFAELLCSVFILMRGHTIRESDTTALPELRLKEIDTAIQAHDVSATPSFR
jgi:hypothetical protein